MVKPEEAVGLTGFSGAAAVFAEDRYVWIFRCSSQSRLHVATLDRNVLDLPAKMCTGDGWILTGQLVVGPDKHNSLGVNMDALRAGIEQDGFYLWNADMEPLPETLRLLR